MNTIKLQDVHKEYSLGQTKITALKNINYELKDQAFTVLTGKSGSGKTTLLNILGCLDSPTSGDLFISNVNTTELNDDELSVFRAKELGFVFQNFNLINVLTCYENVEYPLLLSNLSPSQRKERVNYILNEVGLSGFEAHTPVQLSGGQRQRVSIARALVHKPKLVLADEPTANLDSQTSEVILSLLKKIQRDEKVSFLLSSHDPDVVRVADEKIRIVDGNLEES